MMQLLEALISMLLLAMSSIYISKLITESMNASSRLISLTKLEQTIDNLDALREVGACKEFSKKLHAIVSNQTLGFELALANHKLRVCTRQHRWCSTISDIRCLPREG